MKYLSCLPILVLLIASSMSLPSQAEANYGAYGQGQVYGVTKEEIEITEIKTGLLDLNPTVLGALSLGVSGMLFYRARKKSSTSSI